MPPTSGTTFSQAKAPRGVASTRARTETPQESPSTVFAPQMRARSAAHALPAESSAAWRSSLVVATRTPSRPYRFSRAISSGEKSPAGPGDSFFPQPPPRRRLSPAPGGGPGGWGAPAKTEGEPPRRFADRVDAAVVIGGTYSS